MIEEVRVEFDAPRNLEAPRLKPLLLRRSCAMSAAVGSVLMSCMSAK